MLKKLLFSALIYGCTGWTFLAAQDVEAIINSNQDLCDCEGLRTAISDEDISNKAKTIKISWLNLIENAPMEWKPILIGLEGTKHIGSSYSAQLKELANKLGIGPKFYKYFVGESGSLGDASSFEAQKYILACIYAKQKLYKEPTSINPRVEIIVPEKTSTDSLLNIIPIINEKIEKMGRMQNVLIIGLILLLLLPVCSFFIRRIRKKRKPKLVNPFHEAEKDAAAQDNQEAPTQINEILASLSILNNHVAKIVSTYEQKIIDLTQKNKVETEPNKTKIEQETPLAKTSYPADSKIIYSNHPENGYFNRLSEFFEAQKVVYQIIINKRNPNDGVYTMVDDPETRKYHYNFPDALRQGCNLKGTGNPSLNAKINEGRVQRDGDLWKITKKIDLNW